jgi:hypothetical protein
MGRHVTGIVSQIPPPLPADERRRAFATTGGFVFQWWLTVVAWLELKDDEALYIESSEDFEIVSSAAGTTVQAKAGTHAALTLRSPEVIASLNHFWQMAAQERRQVRFVLLAQTAAGVEQGAPFGAGVAGLGLWMSPDAAVVERLQRFLRDDSIVASKLVPALQQFLRDASPEEFRQRLVECVVFDLGREPTGVVRDLVRDRLIVLAVERHGATVAEAERVSDVLFTHVVQLAASKERIPLSRAHLLGLLEENIVQHRQRVGLAMPPPAVSSVDAGSAALWDSPSNELALPPLPERILRRAEIVVKLTEEFAKSPALILVGSTGMGKTTLAKLTAQTVGGTWWWLDLQGCPPSAVALALRKILAVADRHRGAALNLVLDGFTMEGLPATALNVLRAIAWLMRRRGGKLILTTQKRPTPTEAASFGWTDASIFAAPRMESKEIAGLAMELGCADAPLAQLWAMAIKVHTLGHPQLVHAACLWLQQQGWPKFDGQTFQASGTSVELERAQARSLVARLSGEELELLTRLSVLGDRFRRDHALSLAEKLERLPGAGFRFDALVGPWIEPANATGYHRLSPLLENSAATVAVERRRALEAASALARLENRPVYFQDAALALRHAFDARAPKLVAQVASKFLLTPSQHRALAFPSLLWLMWIPDAAIDEVDPSRPGVGMILHLLRFEIAVTLLPAQVAKYLEVCEQKMAGLPAEQVAGQRFVLLGDALMHSAKNLTAAQIVHYVEETTTLSGVLDPSVKPAEWFPRAMLPPSLRTVSDNEHVRISLAGLVLGQIAGQAFVTDLLTALDALPAERRANLTRAFSAWPTLLALAIDKIWLAEAEKPAPDWESLLTWFSTMATKATAWGKESFGVLFTRAGSVVCNEYLNDPDRAARLIESSTTTMPSYAALLLDQQAKIAAQKKQLPEALGAVRRALVQWEEAEFEIHPKMLALQRAGCWAGKLELWAESAGYFAHGAKLAKKLRLVVNEAGLETDAAVARWRANERGDALDSFVRALELCGKMRPASEDLATYQFQKLLGHILLSLAMNYRRSPLTPVQAPVVPGMASEPALNEKVKTLPPPRLAACKVFVAMLEHNYRLGETRWERYRVEVLDSPSISTRTFALELAIRKAIQRRAWSELVGLAARQASVLAVARDLVAKGNPAEAAVQSEDAVFLPVTWHFEDQMCGEPLFLAALISAVAQGDDFAAALREIDAHAGQSPFPEQLRKWCERGQAIAAAAEADLLKFSRSASVEADRVMACLALLSQSQLTPEALWGAFYVTLTTMRGMYWGADVLRQLDQFAGGRWRRAADNRFAFRNPTLWLPDLRTRCSYPVSGAARLATLLLAALPALDLKMDAGIVKQLQGLSDGTSSGPWQKFAPRMAD